MLLAINICIIFALWSFRQSKKQLESRLKIIDCLWLKIIVFVQKMKRNQDLICFKEFAAANTWTRLLFRRETVLLLVFSSLTFYLISCTALGGKYCDEESRQESCSKCVFKGHNHSTVKWWVHTPESCLCPGWVQRQWWGLCTSSINITWQGPSHQLVFKIRPDSTGKVGVVGVSETRRRGWLNASVCDLNKVVTDDVKSPVGDRQQGWVAKLSALQTSGHELGN